MSEVRDYAKALAQIELFNSFTPEELEKHLEDELHSLCSFSKGQTLYFQEEICQTLDIILKGQVSVQKIDEEGRILNIGTFSAGDHLGANLMFAKNNRYPMTAIADADTNILRMKRHLIINLCQDNRAFMLAFFETISERTLHLTAKIKSISHKTIRERLLAYLHYEKHFQQSNIIRLEMSKKKLAEKLGVQRSSLGRELQKMRRDGLVDYDSKSITLL